MEEWSYSSTIIHLGTREEVNCQLHASAALPPGKKTAVTHRIGGWMGPRTDVDGVE
jgi:hypothetical protein